MKGKSVKDSVDLGGRRKIKKKIFSAFLIFIGSYLPLALILAVQDIPMSWWERPFCDFSNISECYFNPFANPYLSVAFLLLTVLSVFCQIYLLKRYLFRSRLRLQRQSQYQTILLIMCFRMLYHLWELAMSIPKISWVSPFSYFGCSQ